MDGVRYVLHEPESENELERDVIEHAEDIFGSHSFFLPKRRLKSRAGLGSIPDGFVIDFKHRRWFAVEVELSSHNIYNHIVPQVTRFARALESADQKVKLVDAFYDWFKADEIRFAKAKAVIGTSELLEAVRDVVHSKAPTVIIIVDEHNDELAETLRSLPLEASVVEFKTYIREGVSKAVHAHIIKSPIYASSAPTNAEERKTKRKGRSGEISYSGKSIKAIAFRGDRHPVRSWKEMLLTIANLMFSYHKEQFDKVLELRGRKKPYFTKNPKELRAPERIDHTDIYIETNFNANMIVKLSQKLLALFGHKEDELLIELE